MELVANLERIRMTAEMVQHLKNNLPGTEEFDSLRNEFKSLLGHLIIKDVELWKRCQVPNRKPPIDDDNAQDTDYCRYGPSVD